MIFTFVTISALIIYFLNMFTGGKSWRYIREMFYGNYYAEDALINETDKPNSPQAVQSCIDNNIGIKTEIMLSADRRVMVSAYNDLSKEYGVDKKVSETDMEELEELGVMPLSKLIEQVDGQVPLILELKVGENNEALCRGTADLIIDSCHRNIAVCSYHAGMLGWFKDKEKDIFRGIVSAPAKDFKSLSKLDRWMTGNLANNAACRPNFMLYRNRPHSIFVKFAIMSGVLNGVWTIDNAAEGKQLEAEKELIVVRGFMPETVHFKDLPQIEKTPQEIEAEKKMEEKAARRKSKADGSQYTIKERSIAEILADDDETEDDFVDEIKEEISEVVAEIKEEVSEVIQEIKEELSEIREDITAE